MLNFADLTIDTIQNGKKQFIEKYITDPVLKTACNEFVDKQTVFVHTALKTVTTVVTVTSRDIMNTKIEKLCNPCSIDWIKAGLDAWVAQPSNTIKF